MKVVFAHIKNSDLNFVLSMKALNCNSNTGKILVFPCVHPFGCDASSSLGKSEKQLNDIVNSAVCFVLKCCPNSTTKNPALMQNLLNCLVVMAFQLVLNTIRKPVVC